MRREYASYEEKKRVVQNYLNGKTAPTIAKNIGRHRVTIYKWIEIYERNNSFEDLKEKKRSERPPKIRDKTVKRIEKDLQKPASKFGFEIDLWTCTRVHSLLQKKYSLLKRIYGFPEVLAVFQGYDIRRFL